jgi:hypothetical protein
MVAFTQRKLGSAPSTDLNRKKKKKKPIENKSGGQKGHNGTTPAKI